MKKSGVPYFLAVLILAMVVGTFYVDQQRREIEGLKTGFFGAIWEDVNLQVIDSSFPPVAYGRIPSFASGDFMRYVSRETKKIVFDVDVEVRDFAEGLPREILGFSYATIIAEGPAQAHFLVVDVYMNSPAARAGICGGDRILSINGVPTAAFFEPTEKNISNRVAKALEVESPVLVLLRPGSNKTKRQLTVKLEGERMAIPEPSEIVNLWTLESYFLRVKIEDLTKKAEVLARERDPILFGAHEVVKDLAVESQEFSQMSYEFVRQFFPVNREECADR